MLCGDLYDKEEPTSAFLKVRIFIYGEPLR